MFARHPLSIPSTTIYSILLVQFSCLTVLFHNLSPGPLWSSSWSGALYFTLHAFLHQSSFCNTCPYHRSLFCCNINVMSSIPNHSQLPTWKAVVTEYIQSVQINDLSTFDMLPFIPLHFLCTAISRKRYKIDAWFLLKSNRKSYALYRMVTLPMTLSAP